MYLSNKPLEKRVHSAEEFEEIVNNIVERRRVNYAEEWQEYYRGQANECWQLVPSSAREFKNVNDLKNYELNIIRELTKLKAKKGLEKFFCDSPEKYEFNNEWDLIWQAQHLGIPTRLMDWTLDFKVALYFAVSCVEQYNMDGVVWVFRVPSIVEDLHNNFKYINPTQYSKTSMLNISIYMNENPELRPGEINKISQGGRFLCQSFKNSLIPLEQQLEFIPYLEKYIIPKELKKEIRVYLSNKGKTKEDLLPPFECEIQNEIQKIKVKYFQYLQATSICNERNA